MKSLQFPQYEGSEGKAEKVGGWTTHALSERPEEQRKGEPGSQYGRGVAMVPVQQVAKYREYNRSGQHSHGDYSQKTISGIADDLRKGGPTAMREPIWIDYDHEKKWGYISEGNHRVDAAIQAGVSHVPVRIGRSSSVESRRKKGIGAPLHMDNRLVEERSGYFPSEIHPGNFQEFEGHR